MRLRDREDFAGAGSVWAEGSFMMKRALFVGAGFVCLCVTLTAEPLPLSDGMAPRSLESQTTPEFAGAELLLGRSWPGWPSLALEDGGQFSYPGAFGWMPSPAEFLPAFQPVQPRRVRVVGAKPSLAAKEDSLIYLGDEKPDLFYTSGEVGFVYGRYTGKGGGAIKQGYFLTEIGNDKFHLTVGASYTDDEGRYPNRRR